MADQLSSRSRSLFLLGSTMALGVMVTACTSSSTPEQRTDGGHGSGGAHPMHSDDAASMQPPIHHTYAPTYDAIWDEILAPTCATLFCHGGTGLFLDLHTKEIGYGSLVGTPSTGPECLSLGLLRVKPFSPEESLLYRKVTDAPCGKRMPLLYAVSGQLSDPELHQIERWIELGAPEHAAPDASTRDASVVDVAPPVEAGARDASRDASRDAEEAD